MRVVILAGGKGTRLSEETEVKPKPMVEIGGRPILWHILKIYGQAGIDEFVVAPGYRRDVIKRHLLAYPPLNASPTRGLRDGQGSRPARPPAGATGHPCAPR